MKSIDLQGNLEEYFLDEDRKISDKHLHNICKIYQKDKTCRYISLSIKGFICVKNTPMKKTLDKMVLERKITALGDNCKGIGEEDYEKK